MSHDVTAVDQNQRTRCEVWNRVMGYHRPVSQWNTGKRQEHADRKLFRELPAAPGFRDAWPNSQPPGIDFGRFRKLPS